jgi:hypothetical protein
MINVFIDVRARGGTKKSPDNNDIPWNLVAFSKLTVSGFNLRP